MRRFRFLVLFLGSSLLIVGAGCARPVAVQLPEATTSAPSKSISDAQVIKPGYYTFTKSAYDHALASHAPILLYFYAKWCPFCLEQDPRLVALFRKNPMSVVAFRVNYEDNDTDAAEKALANQFNISSQHTFVMLNKEGKEVARKIGTLSDEQIKFLIEMGKK